MTAANAPRVLLAGESWSSYGIHVKGASAYTTAGYEEGAGPLIAALEAHGCIVTYLPNHRAVEEFPYTLAELQDSYDVVILSDIPADSLLLPRAVFVGGERRPNRLTALADFVRAGGGLLMIGGYMSFAGFDGKARYGGTPLAAVLPVEIARHDDREETPEGVVPSVAGPHAVLDGLPAEWPYFLGYNLVVSKPDAEVLLSVGSAPLLAVTLTGAGRAAAFTSDCAPHWGSPSFMEWDSYGRFWGQLVTWLASR